LLVLVRTAEAIFTEAARWTTKSRTTNTNAYARFYCAPDRPYRPGTATSESVALFNSLDPRRMLWTRQF
jgi:hypothetical protein